ncbi:hypothetical protein DFH28DRAFT_1111007 [Melampsora americana]|nr:hypothetical protein DFH28DRAFT_1111007 [Melampsora americana]
MPNTATSQVNSNLNPPDPHLNLPNYYSFPLNHQPLFHHPNPHHPYSQPHPGYWYPPLGLLYPHQPPSQTPIPVNPPHWGNNQSSTQTPVPVAKLTNTNNNGPQVLNRQCQNKGMIPDLALLGKKFIEMVNVMMYLYAVSWNQGYALAIKSYKTEVQQTIQVYL